MEKRTEYSRYYGDFRGVDFSSDHTLVHESRFPYLVNMYKDYAAGGGQGIETVPGFRRRFAAPNGGRIHGIHSCKLLNAQKVLERHVLVHAGDKLYNWAAYPASAGIVETREIVVKDYDEYAADAEGGVRIEKDFVEVKVDATSRYAEFTDVRAIRKVGAQKWISIYNKPFHYRESTDVIRLPGAYTLTQITNDDGKSIGVKIKFEKTIKDAAGNVVARFSAGDAIQVELLKINKYPNNAFTTLNKVRMQEVGKYTSDGLPIVYFEYGNNESPGIDIPVEYRINEGKYCTFVAEGDVPQAVYEGCELENSTLLDYIVASDGSRFAPIEPVQAYNSGWRVYFVYDSAQGQYYQPAADGSKVEKATATDDKLKVAYATIPTLGPQTPSATVIEYNEYDDDHPDYVYFDVNADGGFEVGSIELPDGKKLTEIDERNYKVYGNRYLVKKALLSAGGIVKVTFKKNETKAFKDENDAEIEMNKSDSQSFVFNNKLYILDGKSYLVYDGVNVSPAADAAYIPTTYINIVVGGENADAGKEYEARNILQPKFKHSFIADGETVEYHMNENMLDGIEEVKVYGEAVTDYTVDLVNGKITFATAPAKPETVEMEEGVNYPEAYAGVEITATKGVYPAVEGDGETTSEEFVSMINKATIATIFDNRVFFSGIASAPNLIFWSSLKDPTYIGILNYVQDGSGTTPITAMMRVANSLLVLKADTEQEGAIYYHTPYETGNDVMPKTYPSEAGLAGIGCLGAACNFLDDPVFVSRLGLEAVGYRSLQNERSMEHRSSLVDARLTNLKSLKDAKLCEWGGYLAILVDGKIFLADSRQVYQNKRGETEYEWYYLEDIGVFNEQYARYKYLDEYPAVLLGDDGNPVSITVPYKGANYPIKLISEVLPDGYEPEVSEKIEKVEPKVKVDDLEFYIVAAMYEANGEYHACLCDTDGENVGGTFCPAVVIRELDDNVFFGTTNGVVCSFNFDKRKDGAIPSEEYTFDNRAIYSGCALKMDNCGIPHMTKSTVKKSTVIKVKSFQSTAAKVRVRTNNDPYKEIDRINATRFSFENMDFSDFSFVVGEDSLFSVREKEKKWVEKQYYVYTDEYKKPFALFYVAYKYFVAGKFKK